MGVGVGFFVLFIGFRKERGLGSRCYFVFLEECLGFIGSLVRGLGFFVFIYRVMIGN